MHYEQTERRSAQKMTEDYMCKKAFKANTVGRVNNILLINVDWNFLPS